MIKYFFEYTNVAEDFFRVEILVEGYTGEPIEIQGTATLEMGSNNSVLEPFRGMALKLDLEANINLDFTDLYTENETDVRVNFYRNNQLLYKGFIKPDGIYADFVNDNWTISLDSIDGLGILENLRFVKEDGTFYTGFMTELDIIRNCLYRTTMRLPINTRIKVFHEDVSGVQNVLERTKLNTERFVKDVESSEVEIMDCAEVLKSILDKYNAVVQQYNGEWYIYRPIDIFLPSLDAESNFTGFYQGGRVSFFRYGNRFVLDSYFSVKKILPTKYKIGSNIDGYYPHHANENQRITIQGAISAFRVKYKYGFVRALTSNKYFQDLSNPYNGWIKNSQNDFTQPDGKGLKWMIPIGTEQDLSTAHFQFNSTYEVRLFNKISVVDTDNLMLNVEYWKSGYIDTLKLLIKLETDGGTWYFRNTGWVDFMDYFYLNRFINTPSGYSKTALTDTRDELKLNLDIIESGLLDIQVFAPVVMGEEIWQRPTDARDYAEIYSLYVNPAGSDNEYDGESHTALRKPSNSSNVEDSIEVFNGDMDSDIYVGTMKKLNGQNTKNWHRQGKTEQKELLEIMVEDRIRLQNKPQKVFSGDVFGYVPSLSFIAINNLDGLFFPISYSYDTINNICKFELNEIFGNELQGEIDYNKSYDHGNVVKPTIEG